MSAHQRTSDEQLLAGQLLLSQRHRTWCHRLAATDIDGIPSRMLRGAFVEWAAEQPSGRIHLAALLEYKYGAWKRDHNTAAVAMLADRAQLPMWVVRYDIDSDIWSFRITAMNDRAHAHQWIGGTVLTEPLFVRWLHGLRGRTCCQDWTPAREVAAS